MRIALAIALFVPAVLFETRAHACLLDWDCDGVTDADDNCSVIANAFPLNCDTDQDGYGNICDADFDQNFAVNSADFTQRLVSDLSGGICQGSDCDPGPSFPNKKLDGTNMDCTEDGPTGSYRDGSVTAADLALFYSFFPGPVGASGLTCAGTPGCCDSGGTGPTGSCRP